MRTWHRSRGALVLWAGLAAACGDDPMEPDPAGPPIPPPGPHFSVLPIPFDSIARITPLGHNNKIFPIGHTYWDTCDQGGLLSGSRPCLLERLEVRAPGSGVVMNVAPGDGSVSIEGPPGLIATLSHITPVGGLARGDSVRAGDVIGTMYQTNSFDFAVMNNGIERSFVRPERYPEAYIRAQSPLEQYPASMRPALEGLVRTRWDVIGRLSYDVAGTAAGNWFKQGAPMSDQVFTPTWIHAQLFLGRLTELEATRIAVFGDPWAGMPNRLAVVDVADPSWDALTTASGPTVLRLWGISTEGEARTDFPHGTLLIELLSDEQIRVQWFDGHAPPIGFTTEARIYER